MTTPSDPAVSRRPLAVLRAMIDALDGEVLSLLARRMGLVAEIAEYKREHHLPIRDVKRERDVLEDRTSRAERLGLLPSVVESIFRLLLLSSREKQAALKAQVPLNQQQRTVAVIGGKGGMGSLMARLFSDLGHAVLISDVDTDLRAEDAAQMADVVLVSVPIARTVEVIGRIGPHVREEALLMDVTSLKEVPLQAMLASTTASVVGTHPMFGPGVHSLQGQRIVLCSGRGESWELWLQEQLSARGLVVTHATPGRHDHAMAVVQVLTHFHTQVVGLALSRLGMPVDESLEFTSPVYRMELLMTGRHFAQSPNLYGPIEMLNPRRTEVTRVFQEAAKEIAATLQDQDQVRFSGLFEEVRRYFGDFTQVALEQSSFLIDRLVERS